MNSKQVRLPRWEATTSTGKTYTIVALNLTTAYYEARNRHPGNHIVSVKEIIPSSPWSALDTLEGLS